MSTTEKPTLPYLLGAVHAASFTGRLGLVEGDVDRVILLQGGQAVQVQSRLQEETLGRILLDEGKITPIQYNDMLNGMVRTRKPAGEVLITNGVLGPQDVFSALEFQARKKMSNCFRMVNFDFVLFEEPVPPEAHIARLDMGEVVLSGIYSNYTVDRLLTEFPADEETLFDLVEATLRPAVRIGPKENKLLRSLGAGVALARLMAMGQDLRYLLTVLYAFHALGLANASGLERPNPASLGLLVPQEAPPPAPVERPKAAPPAAAAPMARIKIQKAPPPPVAPAPEVDLDAEEADEFRPPTLASIMDGKIDASLAQKVLALNREDYFDLLGVDRKAEDHAVKSAYYRLLAKFKLENIHEEYPGEKERELATRLLDQASIAFRVLTDPDSRKKYTKALKSRKGAGAMQIPPRILADVEAQKGDLALRKKHFDEAEACFSEAIRLYPNDPSYHYQLGKLYYLRALDETPKDRPLPDAVRRPLLKALALDPRYDKPRLYLGYFAKRNGNLSQAIKEFAGALECNPQNQRAESELRMLKRRLKASKS